MPNVIKIKFIKKKYILFHNQKESASQLTCLHSYLCNVNAFKLGLYSGSELEAYLL